MKKLISILLAALMLASMSTVSFADGYDEATNEYVWDFNDLAAGTVWSGGSTSDTSTHILTTGTEGWNIPDMRLEWDTCTPTVTAVEVGTGNMALQLKLGARASGSHFGIRAIADMEANPDLNYYSMDFMFNAWDENDGVVISINQGQLSSNAGKLWACNKRFRAYDSNTDAGGLISTGVWYHFTAEVKENGLVDTHIYSDDGVTDAWQYDVPVSGVGMLGADWKKQNVNIVIDNMKIGYAPVAEAAYGDISFEADGNNVTASFTAGAAAEGQTAKFILAVVDTENNELVAIDVENVTTAGEKTTSVTVPATGDYEVQAFLWDGDMAPLANSGIIMD